MSPANFSFSLAWDEDEGDIEAAGPGDAEFITTLNPNAHISLLKRIHIPKTQLRRVMADVGGIVKCAVPFQVDISTNITQSRSRSVIFLKVANTTTSRSLTFPTPTLASLRSDILKMHALSSAFDPRTHSTFFIQHRFDDPGKSWSDDAKQTYHPHLTLRRYCNPDNIAGEAHKCSDAIQDHVGLFRSQLGLIIRGITLFRDTSLGPRVVRHFPFGGYSLSCMFQIRFGHFPTFKPSQEVSAA
jgi:hypothetical protein